MGSELGNFAGSLFNLRRGIVGTKQIANSLGWNGRLHRGNHGMCLVKKEIESEQLSSHPKKHFAWEYVCRTPHLAEPWTIVSDDCERRVRERD